MKIIIKYSDGYTKELSSGSFVPSLKPEIIFRIKLNKMPSRDYTFSNSETVEFDNAILKTKNTIRFRIVDPGEKAEAKEAVVRSIGEFFGFLSEVLFGRTRTTKWIGSFAMPTSAGLDDIKKRRYKSTITERRTFTKYKFKHSEIHDYVLVLSPHKYSFTYQPKD